MYSFSWCYRSGSCHNVQCTWTASPYLPCVISVMPVFCVHLNINQQQHQLGLPEKLATEQLLGRAGGTVRHGRRYGPPITVQAIDPPPPLLLQLGRAARCVVSILYGLQPLWYRLCLGLTLDTEDCRFAATLPSFSAQL